MMRGTSFTADAGRQDGFVRLVGLSRPPTLRRLTGTARLPGMSFDTRCVRVVGCGSF